MKFLDSLRSIFAGSREERHITGSESWASPPSLAGVVVTEETATSLGSCYACINVLASDVSVIPFQVVKRLPGGGRVVDHANPIHELVCHSPDEETSSLSWIGSMVWHCNTHGNAYAKIIRDRYLKPVELLLLDPRLVRSKRSAEGKLFYDAGGEVILTEDMIHVANVGFNGVDGKSPIRQTMETIGLSMGVEKFGAAYFGNGINHKGIISTPNKMDQVERDDFRKQILGQHGGPYNAHRFLHLTGGATFTPTTIPAEEAQFIATRKFQLEEICRIFRVPPSKVMDLGRANFANLEETNLDYYDSSLKPWVRRFLVEFTRKLFSRDERRVYSVEHDVSSLFKGRLVDQANADKIDREMGVVCADEIRARRGLPPIPGGKTYLIPLNYAPMDKIASASIETLKGVKPELPKADPSTDPALAPQSITSVDPPSLRTSMLAASTKVLADVARRMARREANILGRLNRSTDLATLCESLDSHFRTEVGHLAEAFLPALELHAIASGQPIDPRDFAGRVVASSRAQILACVEAPQTRAALASLVESWEQARPAAIVALLTSDLDSESSLS